MKWWEVMGYVIGGICVYLAAIPYFIAGSFRDRKCK
jgi:hypothetical protein